MDRPLAGSKNCRFEVSTASVAAEPGLIPLRAATRAVHMRLVVGQRDGLVVAVVGASLGDAGMLHRGASMVKMTWISLPSSSVTLDRDRHPRPVGLGQRGVLEVGRPDAEDDVPAEVGVQAGPGRQQPVGDGQLVPGECHRGAVVADQLGGRRSSWPASR